MFNNNELQNKLIEINFFTKFNLREIYNKKNDHMKNKKIINHNILQINRNEFLLINTKKLKIILKFLSDDQK